MRTISSSRQTEMLLRIHHAVAKSRNSGQSPQELLEQHRMLKQRRSILEGNGVSRHHHGPAGRNDIKRFADAYDSPVDGSRHPSRVRSGKLKATCTVPVMRPMPEPGDVCMGP
jgi:hypothetical protein